ncbi:AT-rich interactive domain-containing protein 5B-like protein [Leptotrombidium deliense]|uniref:AT-rich interactive domain-containing protein 5B-like protein n=1 Tax=Leptotrombidium deliense TaxID=299467 RepID=A0A443SWF7_9ACAR|nr:AT-rich interactive domain-containing protein 5B-like protein [Leptotrombidium deliense]
MSDALCQFVGAPCGQHGNYKFYKAFKCRQTSNVWALGQFFFVRISPKDDPCIGELQLLWEDKVNRQSLSSVRLYFLPEQSPDGRLCRHGEVSRHIY